MTLFIVILPQLTRPKIFLFVFLIFRISSLKTQNPLDAFEPMQIRSQNCKHLLCHSLLLERRYLLALRSYHEMLSKHFLVCIFHNAKYLVIFISVPVALSYMRHGLKFGVSLITNSIKPFPICQFQNFSTSCLHLLAYVTLLASIKKLFAAQVVQLVSHYSIHRYIMAHLLSYLHFQITEVCHSDNHH